MSNMTIKLVALAAALSLTAGCQRRAPQQLPPAPPTTGQQQQPGWQDPSGQQTGIGQQGLPGSRADFLRSVQSDRVFFALDSHSLDDRARAVLDGQAQWLQRNSNVQVVIEGHADERGTREYNLALGDRRANAVRTYLESRGISPQRMTVISWGKERPEALGSNETAWAENRRAVTVVPQ
jgi:peptidoglycan-associated lipoprotein